MGKILWYNWILEVDFTELSSMDFLFCCCLCLKPADAFDAFDTVARPLSSPLLNTNVRPHAIMNNKRLQGSHRVLTSLFIFFITFFFQLDSNKNETCCILMRDQRHAKFVIVVVNELSSIRWTTAHTQIRCTLLFFCNVRDRFVARRASVEIMPKMFSLHGTVRLMEF